MRLLKDKHTWLLLIAALAMLALGFVDYRTDLGRSPSPDGNGAAVFMVILVGHMVVGATLVRQVTYVWFIVAQARHIKHRTETDARFAAIQAANKPLLDQSGGR